MVATESIMNEVNDLKDSVYGDSPVAVEKAKADKNGNIIDEYYATAKSVEDLTDLIGSVDDGGILMELNNVENKLNLLGDDADSRDVNTRIADALAEAQKYADGLAPNYATAEQGALADTAIQPEDIETIATSGSIYDIKEGSVEGTSEADKAIGLKYLVFNCGTASTVI